MKRFFLSLLNIQNIQTINYTKEGYRHWCNRKKALEILGIGKTAFYAHSYKFTYIDYISSDPYISNDV